MAGYCHRQNYHIQVRQTELLGNLMATKTKVLKMSGLLSGMTTAAAQAKPTSAEFFADLPAAASVTSISDTESPVMLPLDLIDSSPYQNRSRVPTQRVEILAKEILRHGLNNPIIVRPIPGGRYELVAGENRVAACRLNNETHIPAFVRAMDDSQSAKTLVLDNFHHGDLSDYEIYKGLVILKRVIQESGGAGSLSEVAELTPWGKSHVHRLLSYGKLPPAALDLLEAKPSALGSQAASDLAKLADAGTNESILTDAIQRIIAGALEQGKAAEWALNTVGEPAAGKASRQPPPRAIRAITTAGGRLVCTLQRTPKGFAVNGVKGVDWIALENDLAEWLAGRLAQ